MPWSWSSLLLDPEKGPLYSPQYKASLSKERQWEVQRPGVQSDCDLAKVPYHPQTSVSSFGI